MVLIPVLLAYLPAPCLLMVLVLQAPVPLECLVDLVLLELCRRMLLAHPAFPLVPLLAVSLPRSFVRERVQRGEYVGEAI